MHQPKVQYCAFGWCKELSKIFLCPLQRRRHNNERISNGDVSSTRHLQGNTEYNVFRRTHSSALPRALSRHCYQRPCHEYHPSKLYILLACQLDSPWCSTIITIDTTDALGVLRAALEHLILKCYYMDHGNKKPCESPRKINRFTIEL